MTASHRTSGPPVPCTWWSDRWAWRGALGAAPLGALAAILYALIVLRMEATDALLAYLLGAALASGVGCLLLGSLGGSVETIRHRLRTRDSGYDGEAAGDDTDHEPADAAGPSGTTDAAAEEHDDARPAQAVAA